MTCPAMVNKTIQKKKQGESEHDKQAKAQTGISEPRNSK